VTRPATGRLLAGTAAALVAASASMSGVLASLENASVDARFNLRHTPPITDIVIVGIDERSIHRRIWPFRRLRHAKAVDRRRTAGARQIVYDVQFTERSRSLSDDLALFDAMRRAGGATLATTISEYDGSTNVLGGDENLAEIRSRAAAADLPNQGGVIRRYPQRMGRLPSIAVVAAARISGRRLPASKFDGGSAWSDFRGGVEAFPMISFGDLLAGRVPSDRLRDKIVLVGATAPAVQDTHATPTSGSAKMPGVEVQANALWTALHGNPLRDPPSWLALVAIALLGLAVPLVSLRLRPLRTFVAACGLAALAAIAAQIAFSHGIVVTVVGPLLALGLSTLERSAPATGSRRAGAAARRLRPSARARGRGAHTRAANDPARGAPAPQPGRRAARQRDGCPSEAHEPALRPPGPCDGHRRTRGRGDPAGQPAARRRQDRRPRRDPAQAGQPDRRRANGDAAPPDDRRGTAGGLFLAAASNRRVDRAARTTSAGTGRAIPASWPARRSR
jgi:CHASE2 domain-containing sensor protein